MAVSASFLEFVVGQMAGLPGLSHRRMFGGVGFYSGAVFFGVADNDTHFFKVDDKTRPKYVRRKMPPFAPVPGQAPMKRYYQVPPSVLEDADAVASWGKEAVGVGAAGAARKPSGRKARRTRR